MTQRIVAIAASLLLAAVALAEPPPPPPGLDIEKLTVLLDLDDTQKAEVDKVLTAQHQAMHAEREQARASGVEPTPEERKAKHDAVRLALHTQLQAILTPAQLKKFDVLTQPPTHRLRPAP